MLTQVHQILPKLPHLLKPPHQLCQSMWVIRIPDTPEFNQSINEPNSHLIRPDPIPVYLWNSRSLVNKLKNFNSFILTSNYKIYGITKTWLSDHIYNHEIFPPNCIIYR